MKNKMKQFKIDKLDLEIIKYLQDDARMSFRKLGKKLGVPHTTVFTRAERLIDKGIIKRLSAILHPHELGLQIGFIVIDAPPSESKAIADKISKFDEARKVFRTFDGKIIVKVIVPGHRHHKGLEQFLSKLNGFPMRTYPIYEVHKFEHNPHPDLLEELVRKE